MQKAYYRQHGFRVSTKSYEDLEVWHLTTIDPTTLQIYRPIRTGRSTLFTQVSNVDRFHVWIYLGNDSEFPRQYDYKFEEVRPIGIAGLDVTSLEPVLEGVEFCGCSVYDLEEPR